MIIIMMIFSNIRFILEPPFIDTLEVKKSSIYFSRFFTGVIT